MTNFVVGSRKSKLALIQANLFCAKMKEAYPQSDFLIKEFVTKGDKLLNQTFKELGHKSLFTKELDQAQMNGEVDFVVHSLKDLPTTLEGKLKLISTINSLDVRDAFLSTVYHKLSDLPDGATVGTSSQRRKGLLQYLHPKLKIKMLRGNVETRIRKMELGEYDGIILSSGGLKRLGFSKKIKEYLDPKTFVPSIGQGALGVTCSSNRQDLHEMLLKVFPENEVLNYLREILRLLEGGCETPFGAYAEKKSLTEIEISIFCANSEADRFFTSFHENISLSDLKAQRDIVLGIKSFLFE